MNARLWSGSVTFMPMKPCIVPESIHAERRAYLQRLSVLVETIKTVLAAAIEQGGTLCATLWGRWQAWLLQSGAGCMAEVVSLQWL